MKEMTLCISKCERKTCKRMNKMSIEVWLPYCDYMKEQKIFVGRDCEYYINEKRGLK